MQLGRASGGTEVIAIDHRGSFLDRYALATKILQMQFYQNVDDGTIFHLPGTMTHWARM